MADRTLSVLRTHDDRVVPAPGLYNIDPAHTSVEFVGRLLMISKVRGRFGDVRGRIVIGEDPTDSGVDVEISAASLDTGHDERDTHLRSADFFNVEQYPLISFHSTSITPRPDSTWQVTGDLKVRDTTVKVDLQTDFEGGHLSPFGDERIGFSAATSVNREDFGLTWNVAVESGGWLVGHAVRIELSVEAILVPSDGR